MKGIASRASLPLWLIAALAVGCSQPTTVKIAITATRDVSLIDAVRVRVFDALGASAPPRTFGLPGNALPGTIVLTDVGSSPELRVVLDGIAADKVVAQAALRFPPVRGKQLVVDATLTPGLLPDADGDGVPDQVDDCPAFNDPNQGSGANCSPAGDMSASATDLQTRAGMANVFVSPGVAPTGAASPGGYIKGLRLTLAADDPSATIYYTIDGSMPTMSSLHGPTPILGVALDQSATVRSMAVSSGGSGPIDVESYVVDNSLTGVAGYLITDVTLNGTSPVTSSAAGQTLSGTMMGSVWVQPACSGCRTQVVYGVDDVDQGCLFDEAPGIYSGRAPRAVNFTITAPSTPGVHEVRTAQIEEASCSAALAKNTLQNRPPTRVAVVIVN